MNRRKAKQIGCCVSSAMMIARAFACSLEIQAEELEFAGTTQITAESYYLNVDTFAVDLEVAEVYAEAGDQLVQGDQILKLTEDSYDKAVSYYTAAVMRADSNLTDVQLEYDQGVLESTYTYETAKAKAEMAEMVKEYQEQELTDTISVHEEILEEIDTRIAELEAWTGTSSGSASSGSGASSAGGLQNKEDSEEESEAFSQKESERETENADQQLSERESKSEGLQSSEMETEAITEGAESESEMQSDQIGAQETEKPQQTEDISTEKETPATEPDSSETETPITEPGGNETESGIIETKVPITEPGGAETEVSETQPENGKNESESGTQESEKEPDSESGADSEEEKQHALEELKIQLEAKNQEYDEILNQLEALGIDTSVQEGETQTDENASAESEETSGKTLQESIEGNQNVKTNLENVQKNLEDVPELVMVTVKAAYPDYEEYIKLLSDCIEQLNADIQTQEAVKQALENEESEKNDYTSDIDMEELKTLLSSLVKTGEEKSELYSQLVSQQEEWIQELQTRVNSSETERADESDHQPESGQTPESEPSSESAHQPESEQTSESEPSSESVHQPESGQTPESEPSSESAHQPESEQTPESETQMENGQPGDNNHPLESEQQSENGHSLESEEQSENGRPSESEQQSETDHPLESEQSGENGQQAGFGHSEENGSPEAENSTGDMSGGTGKSSGGMSMGAGGSSSGASGVIAGGTAQSVTGSQQSAGGMTVSEEDISLFGNEYDLTQVENLLEREPSDSDGALELADQLADSRKTVVSQYEELLREQKITELGIQYTYDSSVLAGKLAEFTYQEEIQEWEETLAEAKEEKADLESQKAFLESMTDGILTADRSGIVSEVSCEEGDIVNGSTPVISYYNMDTVTISIEVPQEDIAKLQVGDSVDVTINGMWNLEGIVAEKASEPQSGTSRTTVNYEVTIEIDNSNGTLTSGLSASVTAVVEDTSSETEKDQEGEDE